MPARKKLNLPQVEKLIEEFQAHNPKPSAAALLAFAEQINGSSFCKPKPPKIKPLSMAKAKAAVAREQAVELHESQARYVCSEDGKCRKY